MTAIDSTGHPRDEVIAVDLGGTNLRVAVVTRSGELTHRQHVPTRAGEGPDAVLDRMARLIVEVAKSAGIPRNTPVGIASPGPINPHTGIVYFTPNLPNWRDVPLGPRISEITGHPTLVANDANCAGLGETMFGAAKGVENVIYLGLGTGVGGAVISGGRLVDGARGLGAELGHVCVAMDGPRCSCGSIGCLEAFISGWAITREAMMVAETADGASIVQAAGSRPINPSIVAEAASAGNPVAQQILARAGRALGAAMGAFINIFNPEQIVIGGGVAAVGDWILGPAKEALPSYSFMSMREDVTITTATLGDDAGLYGAGALAIDSITNEAGS